MWRVSYLNRWRARGYRYTRLPAGPTMGCSELARHCRIADRPVRFALVNDARGYAVCVMDDGQMVDGCWNMFPNSRLCCLS